MSASTNNYIEMTIRLIVAGLIGFLMIPGQAAAQATLRLDDLIDEALKSSPEVLMYQSRTIAARHRIPQAESLADPMFMIGYQNEGFDDITYSEMADSQFMFSFSQMLPYPGKRALKGEMARQEAESLNAATTTARLSAIRVITELFYDLFFTYKNLDIISDRAELFARLEDAASARYTSGMGSMQEVVMAQTEKYMLLEQETMQRQKIASLEAMLHNVIGRSGSEPLGVPVEPLFNEIAYTSDEALGLAAVNSPIIAARERMIAAAEAKVAMGKKEYYPDFTVTAGIDKRGSDFEDMWRITTSINLPIYYKTKQREAVFEAKAQLSEARQDLAAVKLMIAATLKDNYAMAESSKKLMDLYRGGLIPKTYQDFELALSGYINGKSEAITVINRLKTLIDLELAYWEKFTDRGKAIARIEAVIGSDARAAARPLSQEDGQ
jgi:outer membrane protein TolC